MMKRPDADQLKQLQMLRQYNKVVDYLYEVEQDYVESLVSAQSDADMRKLQGALLTIRRLRELIHTDQKR